MATKNQVQSTRRDGLRLGITQLKQCDGSRFTRGSLAKVQRRQKKEFGSYWLVLQCLGQKKRFSVLVLLFCIRKTHDAVSKKKSTDTSEFYAGKSRTVRFLKMAKKSKRELFHTKLLIVRFEFEFELYLLCFRLVVASRSRTHSLTNSLTPRRHRHRHRHLYLLGIFPA